MITNEQVIAAIAEFYKSNAGGNGMRRALEAYERSKWVKFDVDDESTHPIDGQVCYTLYHTGQVRINKWSSLHRFWLYALCKKCVTHWQPMPEFKE